VGTRPNAHWLVCMVGHSEPWEGNRAPDRILRYRDNSDNHIRHCHGYVSYQASGELSTLLRAQLVSQTVTFFLVLTVLFFLASPLSDLEIVTIGFEGFLFFLLSILPSVAGSFLGGLLEGFTHPVNARLLSISVVLATTALLWHSVQPVSEWIPTASLVIAATVGGLYGSWKKGSQGPMRIGLLLISSVFVGLVGLWELARDEGAFQSAMAMCNCPASQNLQFETITGLCFVPVIIVLMRLVLVEGSRP